MSSRGAPTRPRYRADLDGLRGLAIALVVGYHVWGNKVSGGVDVFVTLSGFFFALSLMKLAPAASVGSALAQTARQWRHFAARLVPSAAVVLIATTLLAAVALPSSRWEETSRQVLASLFFVENWHLANASEAYVSAGDGVSPTQQFWSLSVQGQLFLACTLLTLLAVFVLHRVGREARASLAVLAGSAAMVSFGFALYEVARRQEYAYYDSRARAWEFLAGMVAGLVLPWTASMLRRLPPRVVGAATGLALLLLGTTALIVDGATEFPGWATLLPVGATLVLVVAGEGAATTAPQRLLTSRPLRWVGSVAYPLYLWHWPSLVIALAVTGRSHAGPLLGTALVAASLGLAWLTHLAVEQPLRERSTGSAPVAVRRLAVTTLVMVAALPAATWLTHTAHELQDLESVTALQLARSLQTTPPVGSVVPDDVIPAPWLAADDAPGMPRECATVASSDQVVTCEFGDPAGSRTLVAVGGSHVGMWVPALDAIGKAEHVRVVTMFKLACPWSIGPTPRAPQQRERCLAWGGAATRAILELRPDAVLTTGTRPRPAGPGDYIPPRYPSRWRTVTGAGIPVVLLRDVPWMPGEVPACVESHAGRSIAEVARACGAPRRDVLSPDPVASYPRSLPGGLSWIDLTPVMCPASTCQAIVGNVIVYSDSHHLTITFVRSLTTRLERELGRATGWWDPS